METLLDNLLVPVSADAVCGASLDMDTGLYSLYNSLEQAAAGRPAQQMGDSIIPAQGPDWPEVNKLAVTLFENTKDLRVAVHFCRAQIAKHGFAGLAEGTELVLRLLQLSWDGVYPRLIDEEYNDYAPDIRVNAINELACSGIVNMLWDTFLVRSKAFGCYSYRDYCIAKGEVAPKLGGEAPVLEQISNAFSQFVEGTGLSEPEFYSAAFGDAQSQCDCIAAGLDNLEQIARLVSQQFDSTKNLDVDTAIDFKPLKSIAVAVENFLSLQLGGLAAKMPAVTNTDTTNADTTNADTTVDPSDSSVNLDKNRSQNGDSLVNNGAPSNQDLTAIRSREDVIATLDRLCQYYERNEPSSPVPLVLKRAKNMVAMDFLAIMRDISPDSMEQIKKLVGAEVVGST